ncbi:hypothetical protein ACWGBJ_19080 [Streptomyces sp. NPDC054951]
MIGELAHAWMASEEGRATLAVPYGVDRSTITRAVHQIRPLPAARGFAVPGHLDLRLRTLEDVFAHAAAEGVELRLDGTEIRGQHRRRTGTDLAPHGTSTPCPTEPQRRA